MKQISSFSCVERVALVSGSLFVAVVFAAGCGGGGGSRTGGSGTFLSSPSPSATTGRAVFTVSWPVASTRLVPLAAQSIRVDILDDMGSLIATQKINRPDPTSGTSTTATLSFNNLPVKTLSARASAFPQADATGTAQAMGSVPLGIQANQTIQFTLTMVSTIDHIDLSPVPVFLAAGQQSALTATARNAPGSDSALVLTSPGTLQWASSNPAAATVDSSGTVTAVSAGTTTVSVIERESGKTATAVVTVGLFTPSPIPSPTPSLIPSNDPFAGVHDYTNLDLNALPNYANPTYPVHYNAQVRGQDNTPPNNVVTDRGATLGRVLFWDSRLSVNDTVACASCHQQPLGLTDSRQFSPGFSGSSFTSAHAMRLGNVRFYAAAAMFWDKRATSVEDQASQPIQNSVEMGWDAGRGGLSALFQKMNALPYYPELFRWVYGDSSITQDRLEKALAQYERSMVSVNSKFDTEFSKVYDPSLPGAGIGQRFSGYTAQEERGKQLFTIPPNQGGAGCVACHQAPTFALTANSRSNGLDAGETTVFKSPSLKNVGVTGPFMHDGRFQSLEQVVNHYSTGIQNGPALDNRLKGQNNQPLRLNLSQTDRDALVAFLKTLNDTTLNNDPKFTNPFKK